MALAAALSSLTFALEADVEAAVAELAEDCAEFAAAVADAAALSSLTFALDADVDATVAEDAAFVAELAED